MALVGLVRVSSSKQETQRKHDDLDPICVKVFEEKVSGKLKVAERSCTARWRPPRPTLSRNLASETPGQPYPPDFRRVLRGSQDYIRLSFGDVDDMIIEAMDQPNGPCQPVAGVEI